MAETILTLVYGIAQPASAEIYKFQKLMLWINMLKDKIPLTNI